MSKLNENETQETPSPKELADWREAARLANEVTAMQGGDRDKAFMTMCRVALDLGLMASVASRAFLRLPPHGK